MIRVNSYDLTWPQQFLALREELATVLGHLAKSIHHVGSTSVPGLDAKPIIDMDIIVEPQDMKTAIQALDEHDYEHLGDLGIPEREAFRSPSGLIAHNLYLCPPHSQAFANHIAVRDYLRQHPQQVATYGRLKQDLAKRYGNDVEAYVEGKSDFLLKILKDCGFAEDQLLAIKKMNQKSVGEN